MLVVKLMNCRSICLFLTVISFSSAQAAELAPMPAWIEAEVSAGGGTLRGYSTEASAIVSPWSNIYESGPKFRFSSAHSVYGFRDAPADATLSRGRDTALDLLVGYGYKADWWSLLGMVGPTALRSELSFVDSPFSETTTKFGAKVFAALDANPTAKTLVFAQANYSTINNAYFVQAQFGAAVLPNVFIGPEVIVSRGLDYDERKVGVFVFASVGSLLAEISVGYVTDPFQGSGAYVRTSVGTTF
jgi:hypothetical protein